MGSIGILLEMARGGVTYIQIMFQRAHVIVLSINGQFDNHNV